MPQIALHDFMRNELSMARYADSKCLTRHGRKVYSQADEDGILEEIFRRIGATNRRFVEFGVQNGSQCNTMWLLIQGWNGLWIEQDQESCAQISATHASWINDGRLALQNERVCAENIDAIIARRFSGEVDLLSIDIDYNDYWVWKAIATISPRVVVIEYNATWAPPVSVTVPYDRDGSWDGSNYYGASLAALASLGERKGYKLVGCTLSGVNAFFVRRDLCADNFLAPGSSAQHYEPVRYFLCDLSSGHRPRVGPLQQV